MSQETRNPEDYNAENPTIMDILGPTKDPIAPTMSQADLIGMVVPLLQDVKDEVLGLSELRCRVELAKAFIFRDSAGNIHFKRTNFEEVWTAITQEPTQTAPNPI